MEYVITFIEGVISFISPCLLPMIPIYLSYFAGYTEEERKNRKIKTGINALAFVLGFTLVFLLMGIFAGTLGRVVSDYQWFFNIIFGIIIMILGLNFMEVLQIPFLNRTKKLSITVKPKGFLSCLLFGILFSISWTPCIGPFLGSALMMVATQGEIVKGFIMLLLFSLGLGIPFLLSAVLIEKLKTTFDFIKKHYKVINIVCGSLLIIIGFLMVSGLWGKVLGFVNTF